MPGFHHPVPGTLDSDCETVQLTRQANGEVADGDHLLDLAQPLGDPAGLYTSSTVNASD